MANKSLEDPPREDEEVESSAGEEEEDTSIKAAAPVDSESGSETETDSDSETERPPNPNKKEAPASAALALPAVKSGKKRPSESTSRETSGKRINKGDGKDTKNKKPPFQRVWTEEDEIAALQGMIDFNNETGKSPYDDTNAFYASVKESISFEVSKTQVLEKIRSLKKKYVGKEKESFSKAHDHKSLALSKFIWGPEGLGLEAAVKTKKTGSVRQELFASPNDTSDWFENSFIAHSLAGLGGNEEYVKQNWRLVSSDNKKRVEEGMKDLQAREIEFVVEKTKFLHEVATMIVEASNN